MTTKEVARPEGSSSLTTPAHWGLILALYLTGIGMGALDTGIVNPARTVIQTGLGVDDKTGVWIFTIYTLAYAAAIPVVTTRFSAPCVEAAPTRKHATELAVAIPHRVPMTLVNT